jgi:hypothetical protein
MMRLVDHSVRAVRAAVAVAARHGLRVTDPEVLQDSGNVVVWLRPAPVVARVATTTALVRGARVPEVLRREVSVVRHLVTKGAAVVPPSDLIAPGPHRHDGLWLTCWQYVPHDPRYTPGPNELACSLGALHTKLRDYPGELPYLSLVLEEIPAMTDLVERLRLTGNDDITRFRAEFDRLRPVLLADRAQARPLHGDAHPGNVLATENGLLWNDFEDSCAGPAAWDLAAATSGLDTPAPWSPYPAARRLQGVVWTLLLGWRFPARRQRALDYLDAWRQADWSPERSRRTT